MAPAPQNVAKKAPSGYAPFITTLAKLTGLDLSTVIVWVMSERGPVTNPLNIGPGRTYASPVAAAQATAQLLKANPAYHPILAAANSSKMGPKEQLDAIIQSPWDSCRYRGLKPDGKSCANAAPGTLLYGIYAAVFGGPPAPGAAGRTSIIPDAINIGGIAGAVIPHTDQQGNQAGGLTGVGGIVTGAENWLTSKLPIALLYLAFTVGALGLIYLALSRGTSSSPAGAAAGAVRGGYRRARPFPPGDPRYFEDLSQ